MYELIAKSFVVALTTSVIISIITYIINLFVKDESKKIIYDWEHYYSHKVYLLLTGILVHIGCEFGGIENFPCFLIAISFHFIL